MLNYYIFTFFHQIFVVNYVEYFFAYSLLNRNHCPLDLIFEWFTFHVWDHCQMGVSCPCLQRFFIQFTCQVNTFRSCHIILQCIKLLSSISSRTQKTNSIISSIPKSNPTPSFRIQNCLEFFFWDVSIWINSSSIAQNDGRLMTHFC